MMPDTMIKREAKLEPMKQKHPKMWILRFLISIIQKKAILNTLGTLQTLLHI